MSRNRVYIQKLCLASLFLALDILLARFLSLELAQGNRIGLQFIAYGLEGWLLGPYWAMGAAVAGDILGMVINSGGYLFNPLFLLIAALKGYLFGLFLYKKKPGLLRAFATVLLGLVCVDMTLGSYALSQLLGISWGDHFAMKLPFRAATYPIYALLLYDLQEALARTKVLKHYENQ